MSQVVTRMLKGLLPIVALGMLATSASAAPQTICVEAEDGPTNGDAAGGLVQGGCVNTIPTAFPTLIVASDGETHFDPFGYGDDVSDGIQLTADWAPLPSRAAAFAPGFWTQIPGTSTWVLPATTPCGSENDPICEPIAGWYYTPGGTWNPGTPDRLDIREADGSLSDIIWLDNNGPGGSAEIVFASVPVPEPATLGLMALGLGYIASRRRAR